MWVIPERFLLAKCLMGWEICLASPNCKEGMPPGMYLPSVAAMLGPIPASCRPVCSGDVVYWLDING